MCFNISPYLAIIIVFQIKKQEQQMECLLMIGVTICYLVKLEHKKEKDIGGQLQKMLVKAVLIITYSHILLHICLRGLHS